MEFVLSFFLETISVGKLMKKSIWEITNTILHIDSRRFYFALLIMYKVVCENLTCPVCYHAVYLIDLSAALENIF